MNENPTRNQEQIRIDTEYARSRMSWEEWRERTEELSNSQNGTRKEGSKKKKRKMNNSDDYNMILVICYSIYYISFACFFFSFLRAYNNERFWLTLAVSGVILCLVNLLIQQKLYINYSP